MAGVCYAPQGALASAKIGVSSGFTGGLVLTNTYNNRLQSLEFKASSTGGNAMDLSYNFNLGAGDNGNVMGITNNIDNQRSQTFTYDQLNRITSAQTTSTYATAPTKCWAEVYSVDAWGNLLSIAPTSNPAYTGCSQESGFTQTADNYNHLQGFSYDLAGNTSNDGVNGYLWNAESDLKTAAGVNYLYDGDGRRAAKANSANPPVPYKLYWYGPGGQILIETDGVGNNPNEYVFFGGKRVALLPAGSTAQFYAEDMLGSTRIVTSNTGVLCYDADSYPFGGERTPYTNTCTQNNYKFEGKERDTETGNDDFGARYYSNRFGRWLSADWSAVPVAVPYANPSNPQTLNLYAMVADDPESFADLDGHCYVFGADNATCVSALTTQAERAAQQAAQKKKGVPAKQRYKTRDAAAKAAEKAALAATNKSKGKWEYGGKILKDGEGQYTYTIAVTFENDSHFYPENVTTPEGFTVAADYHTHHENDTAEGQGLSGRDEQHSYDFHRVSYVADTISRNLYRFNPADSSQYKPNEWCCGVIGEFVAHIPE